MAENRIKQDEVKQNVIRANYVKRAARIIKWGSAYYNILSTVENLRSATNNMDYSTESVIQYIIPLSYDTFKDSLFHLGGKISDFSDLKKRTVAVEISRRWGKDIIKEGAIVIS